jgi:hypothetical protein
MSTRKPKARPTLGETLRTAIRDSGETLYRVGIASGVPYATLHRFMAGERSVSMEALEKLCAYLGLWLAQSRTKA